MDAILFPDTTALVVSHLNGLLTEPVYGRPPNPRPSAFVTVRRVGGTRQTMVSDNAMLTVEAWADRYDTAHDLAQRARAHAWAMTAQVIDGTQVYRVTEVAGPAELPDPLSEQPRVTFTVQVAVRGAPA